MEDIELIKGDCLEVMKSIPDKSVDMILCDLPYGLIRCEWDIMIPFNLLWEQYNRICKDNAAICLFAAEPFASKLRLSNLDNYRYDLIWQKTQGTGHLDAKKKPLKCHEVICVFYKKLPTYNPIKTYGHERKISTAKHKRNTNTGELYGKCDNFKDYDSTERYPRSVIEFSSDKQKENYHPTQKPIDLCSYLIRTYSKEGYLILDNTMGSGSTGVFVYYSPTLTLFYKEEYLEPATPKVGDLVIHYNHNDKASATIGILYKIHNDRPYKYQVKGSDYLWQKAIKFISEQQYREFIK